MKKLVGVLVLMLLAATVGCLQDAKVEKGGGESAVLERLNGLNTGRIDVEGHVVNTGGRKAEDVAVSIKFFQDGTLFLEGRILIGEVAPGASEAFSGVFFAPPVVGVFTWEYLIES